MQLHMRDLQTLQMCEIPENAFSITLFEHIQDELLRTHSKHPHLHAGRLE